jgi:hypothetical protein
MTVFYACHKHETTQDGCVHCLQEEQTETYHMLLMALADAQALCRGLYEGHDPDPHLREEYQGLAGARQALRDVGELADRLDGLMKRGRR